MMMTTAMGTTYFALLLFVPAAGVAVVVDVVAAATVEVTTAGTVVVVKVQCGLVGVIHGALAARLVTNVEGTSVIEGTMS